MERYRCGFGTRSSRPEGQEFSHQTARDATQFAELQEPTASIQERYYRVGEGSSSPHGTMAAGSNGSDPGSSWRIMADDRRRISARSSRIPWQIDTRQVSRSTRSKASTQSVPDSPINSPIGEHNVALWHVLANPAGARHGEGNSHVPLTDANFSSDSKLPILRCGRTRAT